ncbi:MAG: PQQ-binding-like beta-propeller repeat protein [Armatimonadota bacterium]
MRHRLRPIWPCLALWLGLTLAAGAAGDLTLLHISDSHVPHALAQTRQTLAALPTGESLELSPYGVTVPAPSLAIVTGDLTEFGGGSGWWEQYLELWQALTIPIYHQLGNHDNTWECMRPRLRALHRSAFYAFEHAGVSFIGWDTATPQDPRPSIAAEGLRWVESRLAQIPLEQPVIFFCHHPLDGREFAGEYDRARLLELLHTRNVVLLLVGHGHGVRAWQIAGLDTVMGGSTFGNRPGFGIVSLRDNMLRVCHQYVGEAPEMMALLEKPLPARSPFLDVTVSPPDGSAFAPWQPLAWRVSVDRPEAVREGRWLLDGEHTGALARTAEGWAAEPAVEGLAPGAHVLRVELADAEGRVSSRTITFHLRGGPFATVWRRWVGGSCQCTPTVVQGRVIVGANDGTISAFDAASGEPLWQVQTGGEVRSQAVVARDGGSVYVGSADGHLYALDLDGTERWRCEAGSAIYGSPLVVGDLVVVGTAAGDVVAVEGGSGGVVWRSEAPEYAIEAAPCAGADGIYVGCWDRYAYALELQTGALRWRRPSAGSDREAAARYYSPADCAPAFAAPNVFFADRAYRLTVFEAASGERVLDEEACVAVAGSPDGRSVYVRHTDGRVSKRSADGAVVWTAQVPTGAIATPPVPAGGYVWVISNLGMLSALDEHSGVLVGQQRVSADIFCFAAPAFDGERVYIADMTGGVSALRPTWLGEGP